MGDNFATNSGMLQISVILYEEYLEDDHTLQHNWIYESQLT
jgi:hypothetical protein